MGRRWALVTAGAQGLGGAITERLIESGFDVLIHHRASEDQARALEAKAKARKREARLLFADLSLAASRVEMIDRASTYVGRDGLALLVNNLGVYPAEHLLKTPIEVWENTFSLTCTTVFHITQLTLPLLRAATPVRHIINIGDSGCDRIESHDAATPYHIAKLGVHVLTRTYAAQLAPERITVNMISPGFLENSVGTPAAPIPAGRKGRHEDVLSALDWLTSDGASYVTGANVVVSGGWNL